MREIKFRAWDKDKKQMLHLPLDNYFGLSRFFGFIPNTAIVEQFTGLKDKNGKEIYEGDIDSEGFVFMYRTQMGGWYRMKNGVGYSWHEQACTHGGTRLPFEVIGNIHENPELLK